MPLRALVGAFGWRPVMLVVAAVTALLTAAIWAHVRDDPAERGFVSYRPADSGHRHGSVLAALAEVLSYRNSWCLLLAQIGVSGAVLTFGGLWGVPYLRQVHGLEPKAAAAVASAVFIAWALGGPLLGTWSERLGRRKPLYVAGSAICLASWLTVALVPLPLVLLLPVLLLAGFFAGIIIVGFAFNRESLPARLAGTASGVCNMGPLLGGMILQPGVGWILDRHWQGALENGARVYDRGAYEAAFLMMTASLALSLLLALLTRETYCRLRE